MSKLGATFAPYPIPTDERRRIVQALGQVARDLDDEASTRRGKGSHNGIVRDELMRAAGVVRLVATLVLNGSYTTQRAKFWVVASADYLRIVQRLDERGVIR